MKKTCLAFLLLLTVFTGKVFAEENEVFLLGLSQMEEVYYQANSSLDPMNFKGKKAGMFVHYIAGPAKIGSEFVTVEDYGPKASQFGLKAVLFRYDEPVLQEEKCRLDTTPNERGICLFHQYTNMYTEGASQLDEYKSSGLVRKAFQNLIKAAIKEYAGTEWEAALNAELEEWK